MLRGRAFLKVFVISSLSASSERHFLGGCNVAGIFTTYPPISLWIYPEPIFLNLAAQ